MIFKAFRIKNYKSFIDTGKCSVQNGVTILAGQNESGKSNVLNALEKINYDSPKFDETEYCFANKNNLPEITYWFEMTDEEKKYLNTSFQNVDMESEIEVYISSNSREVYFQYNPVNEFDLENMYEDYTDEDIEDYADTIEDEIKEQLEKLLPRFVVYRTKTDDIPDTFTVNDLNNVAIKRLSNYLDYDFEEIFLNKNQQSQRKNTKALSKAISEDFREKYTQREVELEFDINGEVISIFVNDINRLENQSGYPFHLSQRSMGLQWYLNFYIALKGEALKPGDVILIDEPGMYLHPKAQQEMREVLNEHSKSNQVIYTTHSPYLIDGDNLMQLRLVEKRKNFVDGEYNEISEIREKIHQSNNIDTLKPIHDAIGYSLNSELNLQHKKILICEGVSDYYYVKTLEALFGQNLDCGITFANGCSNIGTIVSLYTGLGISDVYALVDSDKAGIKERNKLIKDGVLGEDHCLTTDVAENVEHAMEDIFDLQFFFSEILEAEEYDEDTILSKYITQNPAKSKYILAKQTYDKVVSGNWVIYDVVNKKGKELFDKLLKTIND